MSKLPRACTLFTSIVAALALAACSERESAAVKIDDPYRTPPQPQDTELRLAAGGYEGCSGDDEVTDVSVEEDGHKIRVSATVNVDQTLGCEVNTSATPFTVSLEEPLGDRRVVDVSDGRNSVIWSPERSADFTRARELTDEDAERALRDKYPGADRYSCARGGTDYFYCSYRRGDEPKVLVNLRTQPSGGFAFEPVP